MKITANISDKKNILKYKNVGVQALIIGLKNFNISANLELSINEINQIVNENKDIDIFISIDKFIFNEELEELKNNLIALSKIDIKGVLFYDLSILNIVKTNNLNLDLVWNQTHMVTNYNTCNCYYDKDVKYACLSSEITLEEIIQISKNTKTNLMINLVGYPNLSHSRRKLLTNFYESTNENNKQNTITISEKNHKFIVKETNNGTTILGGNIVNGTIFLDELLLANISYIILNDYMIEECIFIKVISSINNYLQTKDKTYLKEIEQLIGNDTHFFNKKTIYKVKK